MNLEQFLSNKPLYYKEIDYSRMPRAWESIKHRFLLPKIIHIVGTNGKGSTGRFLAHYLYKSALHVGHYTSPHIMKFNERIWLNGKDVDDEVLELAHQKLLFMLDKKFQDTLSYFEYTTLLAMVVFEKCDYIILEAGLGGEYDATAVFDNILTLVTPIDYDHQSFLGNNISDIAKTKLNAVKKFAILADQKHKEVYNSSQKLVIQKKGIDIFRCEQFFTPEEMKDVELFINQKCMAQFLKQNLSLALCGIKFLGLEIDLKYMDDIILFGRCYLLEKNITIDVGHNPLAASVLATHFKNQKITLIFNSYGDKEYKESLSILKPIIKNIEIIPILDQRIEDSEKLIKVIESLNIKYSQFDGIDENQNYLVFGSFLVVERFLKYYESKII